MTELTDWKHVSELITPKFLEELAFRREIEDRINEAQTYFEKLRLIRTLYSRFQAEILEEGRRRPDRHWLTPYLIDWVKVFTPVEYDAWCSFRFRGMVMYPQYPVLKYFVDFGNPTKKIAIEIDGKGFHDANKDRARDTELLKAGWKVFRITGSEMYKTDYVHFGNIETAGYYTEEDQENLIYWLTKTGDGVIEAIWEKYFRGYGEYEIDDFYPIPYFEKALSEHRLIQ